MRTTVDLPDEMYRELKTLAARRGTTLKELLASAAARELSRAATPTRRVEVPLVPSAKPASLALTNAEIDDLLT
jgi:hypothetical protein